MPECIVCKGIYESGERCERCGTDNKAWEDWKKEEEKTLPTPWALLGFAAPYLWLLLLIAIGAPIFGLGMYLLFWSGVQWYVSLLVIMLSLGGSIFTILNAHAGRFKLREDELLRRVKRGRAKGIGITKQALRAMAIAIGAAIFLSLCLIQIPLFWALLERLLLMPQADVPAIEGLSLQEKITRILPLICLIGYALIPVTVAYFSSIMLAQGYARRLSERVPLPIFLQEDLLATVVKKKAAEVVGRSAAADREKFQEASDQKNKPEHTDGIITPHKLIGADKAKEAEPKPKPWVWDEMERMDDGGIRLKALVQDDGKKEGEQPIYITYVVEADPWGRITKVEREKPD
jgi:hypothetical protein